MRKGSRIKSNNRSRLEIDTESIVMDTFTEKKLEELIVFFAHESAGDTFFGSTKLNKLLFIADFLAYGYLGKSITGTTYIHQDHGPTPAPRQFMQARENLINQDRLEIVEELTYTGLRKRPVAKG